MCPQKEKTMKQNLLIRHNKNEWMQYERWYLHLNERLLISLFMVVVHFVQYDQAFSTFKLGPYENDDLWRKIHDVNWIVSRSSYFEKANT